MSIPFDPGNVPIRLHGMAALPPHPLVGESPAPAIRPPQVALSGDDAEDDLTIELSGSEHTYGATDETAEPMTSLILSSRYLLQDIIGRGASCLVFRAQDLHPEPSNMQQSEFVAVKLLRPEQRANPLAIARLKREFEQMQVLSHPAIVRVFGLDCDGDIWFMTMELVIGCTIKARMATPASIENQLVIIGACCEALEYSHALEILHGDLKPSNVMVTDDGVVKLIDFGSTPGGGNAPATGSARTTTATPLYASPQILAGHGAEQRDDIFSLACLSYSMLSDGQHPFGWHPSFEDGRAKVDPTYARSIPMELFKVIGLALSAERERRPASVSDFLRELTDADRRRRVNAAHAQLPEPNNDASVHRRRSFFPSADRASAPSVTARATERHPPVCRPTSRSRLWSAELALFGRGRSVHRGAPSSARLAALVFAIVGAGVVLRLDPTSGTLHRTGLPIVAAAVLPELPLIRPQTVEDPEAAPVPHDAGVVSFEAATVRASAAQSLVAISVKRMRATSSRAAFVWRVERGTAYPGVDYELTKPQVVRFIEGQAVRTLFIPLINTGLAQLSRGPRSFTVVLEQVAGGPTLGRYARATVAIDPPPASSRYSAYQARTDR